MSKELVTSFGEFSHKMMFASSRYAMSCIEELRKPDLSPEEHEKVVGNTRIRIPGFSQGDDACSPA